MKHLTPLLAGISLFVAAIPAHVEAAPKVPVKVETLQEAPMTSTFNVHGTVMGRDNVTLTAGASGQLIYVAEPGTFLQKGEVAARIDMLPLKLQKAEQQALIKRAQINVNYHIQELGRLSSLAKIDAAAQFQIDTTQNSLDLAKSDIEIAQLKLQQIDDRITRATVRAPFDGVVSQRFERAGGDINRADQLLHLIDIDNLETRLYVPIKFLPYMKLGQSVEISSGEFEMGQQASAQISAIIPSTDARSQTFEIRAKIDLTNGSQWASGQLVDVQVPIVKTKAVTMINRDALIIRRDGIHVVKIDAENKAKRIPVKVGKGEGEMVEISTIDENAPLAPGDKIAVRGAERLQDGQEVVIQSAS